MFVYCDQQARAHYSFGPLSVCLSMNYWDRFLSVYPLPVSSEIGPEICIFFFFFSVSYDVFSFMLFMFLIPHFPCLPLSER